MNMSQIQVLNQLLINKIAAGEVVESPKSVVKELLENAIDAQSDSITVEVRDGGTTFIRVTDNGCGIPSTQVEKAFLRHATSKINKEEDLFQLHTLGFRGEALASICAVSILEIYTKTADELMGTYCLWEGGSLKKCMPVGTPTGTTMIVKDLFFNTPARKKFLKSTQTEGNAITSMMEKMALSNPELMIKYVVQQQTRIQTMGNGDLNQSIYEIFGKQSKHSLLPISTTLNEVHISGFIGKPEMARGNRDTEIFFVNGRYIKSKLLSEALELAYQSRLMQHKFPFCVLSIQLPEQMVDVNVHPAKMEVRFQEPQQLSFALKTSVLEALEGGAKILEAVNTLVIQQKIEENKEKSVDQSVNQSVDRLVKQEQVKQVQAKQRMPEPFEKIRKAEIFSNSFKEKVIQQIREDSPYEKKFQDVVKEPEKQIRIEEFLSIDVKKPRHIIGQIFKTYWLVEFDEELYFIDQHAAHERILFEQMMKKLNEKTMETQQLSPPMIETLTASQQEMLSQNAKMLKELGFEIEDFGENEFAVRGIPYDFAGISGKALLQELLDSIWEEHEKRDPQLLLEKIAMMSCKAAVKGNQQLAQKEIETIISQLLDLEDPYHCPHGRPTIVKLSLKDVERMFRRVL